MLKSLFRLFLAANILFLTISQTAFSQMTELSTNILRRVNSITVELDKAEDALNRKHSAAFQGYIQGAERAYQTINKYYNGSYDPKHPILLGLEGRFESLQTRMDSTTHMTKSIVQIDKQADPKERPYQEEMIEPDYQYSEVYDGITENTLHSFKSNKEVTIKSAIDNLSYASGSDILIAYEDDEKKKTIIYIELQLKLVRAQLFSATKGSQVLKITQQELIQLKPLVPITVVLNGSEKLIAIIQNKYNENESMKEALVALDESYFPAVMNIENYEFVRYIQLK